MQRNNHIIDIKMPYVSQGKNSANCGPCCLKMIFDYYYPELSGISVHTYNRLLRVSKRWGTEISHFNHTLARLGLRRIRVDKSQINQYLKSKIPLISLIIDENREGHYTVIKGVKKNANNEIFYIFHDSFHGKNYIRSKNLFLKQAKFFKNWIWAIIPA